MEIFLERMWLQIKGMRTMFLIPLIGYYCVIPLGAWVLSGGGTHHELEAFSKMCYLLVPFLSAWWILLITKESVEGNGREILLLGSSNLINAFLFVIANFLCLVPLLFLKENDPGFMRSFQNLFTEMVIVSFFMGGMAYFFIFITKNLTASLYVIVLYTAISNYSFMGDKILNVLGWIQLVNLEDVPSEGNYWLYAVYIMLGLAFFALGERRSKRVG